MKIESIVSRKIYDGSGTPALACDTVLNSGILLTATVAIPHASRSSDISWEQQGDWESCNKLIESAVTIINSRIQPMLIDQKPDIFNTDLFLQEFTQTESLSADLVTMITMAASMSIFRAHALVENFDVYEFVSCIADTVIGTVPNPIFHVLHCSSSSSYLPAVEEYYIIPTTTLHVSLIIELGMFFTHTLRTTLHQFCPRYNFQGVMTLATHQPVEEILTILSYVIATTEKKYGCPIKLGLVVNAARFYNQTTGLYLWETTDRTSDALDDLYGTLTKKYPIAYIKNGFANEHIHFYDHNIPRPTHKHSHQSSEKTENQYHNTSSIISTENTGTVTELIAKIMHAQSTGADCFVTLENSKTTDTFMIDLAVGTVAQRIITGGCYGSEAIERYNRLLMIADLLSNF